MTPQPYSDKKRSAMPTRWQSTGITAVMLLLLVVFARAGVWQLERAGEKEDLRSKFAANSITDPRKALVSDSLADQARFQMFLISGRYDPDRQILLDNMVSGGVNGYHVLTPFITDNLTVMVNRGWVKADPDRREIPDLVVADNTRTILTRLTHFPAPGIRLPEAETDADTWPRRLLFPTRDQIASNIGYEIPDYQLLLDATADDGFLRNWQPLEVGPERNLGYAFQWFALAALTLVIYSWMAIRWRKKLKEIN